MYDIPAYSLASAKQFSDKISETLGENVSDTHVRHTCRLLESAKQLSDFDASPAKFKELLYNCCIIQGIIISIYINIYIYIYTYTYTVFTRSDFDASPAKFKE